MRRASCIFSQAFTDIHLRFQLLASGRIKGELSGKRFTPDAFIQAQKRAVKDFFQSNGCISWSRVEALQVTLELRRLSRTLLRPLVSQTSHLTPECAMFRSLFLEVRAASNSAGRLLLFPQSPSEGCSRRTQ
jgi:hypothetical protein